MKPNFLIIKLEHFLRAFRRSSQFAALRVHSLVILCGVIYVSQSFFACGGGGGGSDSSLPGTSVIRLFHAIPDSPRIDLLIDDVPLVSSLPYRGITNYIPIAPGRRNLQINATNTFFPILSEDIAVRRDTTLTAFVVNTLQFVRILIVEDAIARPLAGNTNIRFAHVAANGIRYDVYVTSRNADIQSISPSILNIGFEDVSRYTTMPSGDYRIRITPRFSKTVVADSGTVNVPSRGLVTVVLSDAPGGEGPLGLSFVVDPF